jgi:hypothetical protein
VVEPVSRGGREGKFRYRESRTTELWRSDSYQQRGDCFLTGGQAKQTLFDYLFTGFHSNIFGPL